MELKRELVQSLFSRKMLNEMFFFNFKKIRSRKKRERYFSLTLPIYRKILQRLVRLVARRIGHTRVCLPTRGLKFTFTSHTRHTLHVPGKRPSNGGDSRGPRQLLRNPWLNFSKRILPHRDHIFHPREISITLCVSTNSSRIIPLRI